MKLGKKVPLPKEPDKKILDTFPNPGVDGVTFFTKEFTSLCPITGQPDWCDVYISYNPSKLCVESKSLKLYLQSYRNEKGFVESLTRRIIDDLRYVLNPLFIFVSLTSTPRGGILIKAEKSYRGGTKL